MCGAFRGEPPRRGADSPSRPAEQLRRANRTLLLPPNREKLDLELSIRDELGPVPDDGPRPSSLRGGAWHTPTALCQAGREEAALRLSVIFASGGGGRMDSRFLMTLQVAVVGAQKIGAVPHGTRVTPPIASGHFEGPRLRGKVLPGGGDWTLLRGDGVLELDLRITLTTDDGALVTSRSCRAVWTSPSVGSLKASIRNPCLRK